MKVVKNIIWNFNENRLRAGWRFLIYLILFVMLTVGKDSLNKSIGSAPLPGTVIYLFYLMAGLGLTWLMAHLIDRRPLSDFGFHFDRKLNL